MPDNLFLLIDSLGAALQGLQEILTDTLASAADCDINIVDVDDPVHHPPEFVAERLRFARLVIPPQSEDAFRNTQQTRGLLSTIVADLIGGVCSGIVGLWLGGGVSTATSIG